MTPPPQGPIRAGQPFESWLLAGLVLQAEAQRDVIRDIQWRYQTETILKPSPLLSASIRAYYRIRGDLETMAYRVAVGVHSFDWACCVICSDCPEHFEELIEDLRREVGLYRVAIDRQIGAIERRLFLLCGDRAPGEQIIAAAETVPGPLARRRIIEVCQRIATTSRQKHTRRAYA